MCVKMFMKIGSVVFYVKLLTDRQTDRQTNAGHYITTLAEVTMYSFGK